jgi:CBS-domain-containing membrane protein
MKFSSRKSTRFLVSPWLNDRSFRPLQYPRRRSPGSRSRSRSSIDQPQFSYRQVLFCWLGSFLGIVTLAYLSVHTSYPFIAAPFGATAVLVFAVPDSPLAQPRNLIGGNCIGAIVCITLVYLFGTSPWVMALAVATAIKLMQLTKTLHPPGGAVALVGVMSGASWDFLLAPVLAGSIIIVLCTIAFNNLIVRNPYPKYWF